MQKDIVLRAFLKKNMKLPELFEEKMRRLLGEDFSEYEKHLDDPAYYGIRVNTLKISVEDFLKICPFHVTKVPWTDNGFYVDREEKPSKHPYYHAGASYLAEAVMVKRDCELAVKTGAKVDIQHISSGVAVDYVKEAKEKGANVYAEASPHHFTLTEEAVLKYGTLARMNPPLRTEEDRQRIIKGLQEGTIEIIATDHAPHSKEEKDKPLDQAPSGITGIETSLALGVTELVEKGYLSMMQLLEKMTINPAKLYNMEQGRLQEGKPADVVLFDPEEEWEVKEYKSKATNSPFTGWKLKGKVKYTICDGKIIEL